MLRVETKLMHDLIQTSLSKVCTLKSHYSVVECLDLVLIYMFMLVILILSFPLAMHLPPHQLLEGDRPHESFNIMVLCGMHRLIVNVERHTFGCVFFP